VSHVQTWLTSHVSHVQPWLSSHVQPCTHYFQSWLHLFLSDDVLTARLSICVYWHVCGFIYSGVPHHSYYLCRRSYLQSVRVCRGRVPRSNWLCGYDSLSSFCYKVQHEPFRRSECLLWSLLIRLSRRLCCVLCSDCTSLYWFRSLYSLCLYLQTTHALSRSPQERLLYDQ